MINEISFPALGIEVEVNRVAFNLFGMPIYWYGLLIAAGLVLAALYGARESKKTGLDTDDYLNMLLISVPVSIVCARLYYVLFNMDSYDFVSALDIRSGGLAIYGGIIGACLVIFIYCRVKKISVGLVLDVLSIGLLIGQAVGRWGNFVNGEAFGGVTNLPWAMTIVNDGEVIAGGVHPTFFYEFLWNLIGIGILLIYKKIKVFNGELFCAYMVWYGMGRMWIEGLRADSLYIGDLRVSQMLSIVILVLGMVFILIGRYRRVKNNSY